MRSSERHGVGYGYEGNDWTSSSDYIGSDGGEEKYIRCPNCEVKLRISVLKCPKCGAKVQDPKPATWFENIGGAIMIFFALLMVFAIFSCLAEAFLEIVSLITS
ncbi:hypothetical protein Pla110_05870 [Polystyrenella longa]|uniref:Uncharacterized protein n=1 Tax=Polystyrenella longa TaxID=2528007 RepID=A0A518CI31_9PLAN|nr:eukaryotic translation initiation factor eIF-2-beta/eIF-5 family protein [Polystyrenella longa]QDU78883.1 hypothetical protein Pla110_05870 [Polystyrenella longa]